MYQLDAERERTISAYSDALIDAIVTVVGAALKEMQPVNVSYGAGTVGFAMNRREKAASGVKLGVNTHGPMDHSVPVIRIDKQGGILLAVLLDTRVITRR